MQSVPDSGFARDLPAGQRDGLAERVDALVARVHELEAEVRASAVASDAKTLKELAKALDAWSKHDPKLEERVANKVDGLHQSVNFLTQRLDTLATTVATTASGLSGREGELAALRRMVKEDNAAVATTIADLRQRVDPKPLLELGDKLKAVSHETLTLKRGLQRISDTSTNRADLLAERMEALGKSVSGSASALAVREREIAELRAALEDWAARTERAVAHVAERENEIGAHRETLAEHESGLSELRTLLNGTTTHVDAAVGEFRRSFNVLASKVTRLDEITSPDAVQGLADRLDRMAVKIEESAQSIDSLEGELRTAVERDAENEAVLQRRLEEGDIRADSAIAELRQAVDGLASRLTALDDVPDGETVRRLETQVDVVGTELDGLVHRVVALGTTVEETEARGDAKTAEIGVLARRFDEARTRVELLVGDLREAIETMPGSSAPDPAFVEHLEEVTDQVATLTNRLDLFEADAREHIDGAGSRNAMLERLMADGMSRLATLERDQAAGVAEAARAGEASASELHRLGKQLEALAATQAESAEATRRVSPLLDELTTRLEEVDGDRSATAEEIVRIAAFMEAESSALRQELAVIREGVARVREAPREDLAEFTERLEMVERDQAARAAEVSQVAEISASERRWMRQELEAVASGQVEVARVESEVKALVDALGARVGALHEGRDSAAGEMAHMAELVAAERTSLRTQLDTLAAALAEQASRRSDRSEALLTELADRLDAVERAGIAATAEFERLAALRATDLASIAKLDHSTARGPGADSETRDLVAELAAGLDALTARLASLEKRETTAPDDVGDGRFRVELRSLGLRMEHAEAGAREDREAVLVELEHLASRLHRLESVSGHAGDGLEEVDSPVGDGVPFRTEA